MCAIEKGVSRRLVMAVAVVALAGCQKLATVKVSPPLAEMVGAGATTQAHADQLDADGKPMDQKGAVSWSSDNATVASVDANGLITAHKTGKAQVTAMVGAVKGGAAIRVQIPARIAAADLAFTAVGQSKPLQVTVTDDTNQPILGQGAALKVTTSDPRVAAVAGLDSGAWTVAARGMGTARLTLTMGAATLALGVVVAAPPPAITDIKASPSNLSLKVGRTQKLEVSAMAGTQPAPAGAVVFTTSDPKVASVGTDGTVRALSKGKATITASAGARTATVALLVKK